MEMLVRLETVCTVFI